MDILVIGIPVILVFVALSMLRSLDQIKQSQAGSRTGHALSTSH